MPVMIQVRNVPDALHSELVRRAQAQGLTLTAYIQAILEREAGRPSARVTHTVILDASAIVGFILDAGSTPPVTQVIGDEGCRLFVPHLYDLEVASALRTAIRRGSLSPVRAKAALDLYAGLPIQRFDHVPLLRRMLGLRDNFSAYDAAYVALAEAAEAPLYTADGRLARAVGENTEVEVVEV